MGKNNKKEDKARKKFHLGMLISFWGLSKRLGRIIKMYDNVGAVDNNNEVWLVPYTCMRKV